MILYMKNTICVTIFVTLLAICNNNIYVIFHLKN